jgi:hypothetical protein
MFPHRNSNKRRREQATEPLKLAETPVYLYYIMPAVTNCAFLFKKKGAICPLGAFGVTVTGIKRKRAIYTMVILVHFFRFSFTPTFISSIFKKPKMEEKNHP